MQRTILVLLSIVIFSLLISCKQTENTETNQAELTDEKHYVSIDGLWRCTPETAVQFPNGTLEPVIKISGDAYGNLSVQGCFLWDGQFYDYWDIKDFKFTDSTNQFEMVYEEGNTYKGKVDRDKKIIRGAAYSSEWGDSTNDATENKLDFIRDENSDENRFFFPRPAGYNGTVEFVYKQPEEIDNFLQTASIFQFINDSTEFYNLIERIIKQEFGRLESLLIMKDQKLVLEEYFYGYSRNELHHIHSCTKSVISLLLGISLYNHNKTDVNQSIFNFFPQFDSLKTPEKEKITLKHVLTMTSGFAETDDYEIHNPNELVKEILSLPLESVPGEKFQYNNNSTELLGGIIYTLENKQADEFAKDVLFNKLDITDFNWEGENGVIHHYSDLHMYPRDMAKIGLLVLNNGLWDGEQIVLKEWIEISTKPYVPESDFFDYGFQWWYRSKQNKSWWDDPVHGSNDEHDMFLALGYGGQYIMVIRDLNMVIVTTSSDYNESNGMAHAKVPMVIEEIVPLFD